MPDRLEIDRLDRIFLESLRRVQIQEEAGDCSKDFRRIVEFGARFDRFQQVQTPFGIFIQESARQADRRLLIVRFGRQHVLEQRA